ncbi:ADP-ribosyl cyclase/cyclic ADP-ribose hydrolase 2-like [Acanthaster planci]|uniref:ADP-ribosyl cyclase/cyclic ADP-ribose hydrolase 2-like n=1 Tax=Acanthaster planci TaxID=133434 RepID=A0A8B7ZFI5_ACAPL|nr:ADP-ribosyl cyclase/cyclic ADP-ribose hydrolase 2-like [Acanthaster planci]
MLSQSALSMLLDLLVSISLGQHTGKGSTLNLKEIVVGRCWDYQRVIGMEPGRPHNPVDCAKAWAVFTDAFAHKDPCETPPDAFSQFAHMMTVSLPKDGTMFWSGTKDVALTISSLSHGSNFSLENTLLGYTVNGLTWCGKETVNGDGINYDNCPSFDDPNCRSSVSSVFWTEASKTFAMQATGSVDVFLNGSDPRGAFRENSFFATVELPNLNTALVNRVNIIVIHNLYGPVIDTCGTGTILTLQSRIEDRGMDWSCDDDPEETKIIQCLQYPHSYECELGNQN